jgi:hypothetical protein
MGAEIRAEAVNSEQLHFKRQHRSYLLYAGK